MIFMQWFNFEFRKFQQATRDFDSKLKTTRCWKWQMRVKLDLPVISTPRSTQYVGKAINFSKDFREALLKCANSQLQLMGEVMNWSSVYSAFIRICYSQLKIKMEYCCYIMCTHQIVIYIQLTYSRPGTFWSCKERSRFLLYMRKLALVLHALSDQKEMWINTLSSNTPRPVT